MQFSYQGIADYLNTRKYMEGVRYKHIPVADILPAYNEQYPGKRVRLQMFWQAMFDTGLDFAIEEGHRFLASEKVRYYYKCTFWEALGQCNSPSEKAFLFILGYWRQTAYSVLDCLALLSKSDEKTANSYFLRLLDQDLRVLTHRNAPHFLLQCYAKHCVEYEETVARGFTSEDQELSKAAALSMAAIYIYEDGCKQELFRDAYNEPQAEGLADQLMYCMKLENWSGKAKPLLLHLVNHCSVVPFRLMHEYLDKDYTQPPDYDVLKAIVEQTDSSQETWEVLDFLLGIKMSALYDYREIVCCFCERICHDLDKSQQYWRRDDISKLLLKLLDLPITDENERARYLGLFDGVFQAGVLNMNDLLRETQK